MIAKGEPIQDPYNTVYPHALLTTSEHTVVLYTGECSHVYGSGRAWATPTSYPPITQSGPLCYEALQ